MYHHIRLNVYVLTFSSTGREDGGGVGVSLRLPSNWQKFTYRFNLDFSDHLDIFQPWRITFTAGSHRAAPLERLALLKGRSVVVTKDEGGESAAVHFPLPDLSSSPGFWLIYVIVAFFFFFLNTLYFNIISHPLIFQAYSEQIYKCNQTVTP